MTRFRDVQQATIWLQFELTTTRQSRTTNALIRVESIYSRKAPVSSETHGLRSETL